MTPAECAAAVKKPIGDVGLAWMGDPLTLAAGRELGLRGRPLYYLGRGGALGDVPVDVVVAAFGFNPPDKVAEHWEAARAVMTPQAGARAYAGMCNEWGRRTFSDKDGVDRALGLLELVADGAEPLGLPLFAAWRALPRPDDAPGRLAQVMNVMREHRGAVHVAAVAAVGLGPLEAVVSSSYGEVGARFVEWPEPYPDPAPFRARRDAAEDLTEAAAAPPYDALKPEERVELADLLTRLMA